MALISPKNLLTPFTNKVHLGTIVFVVALFATFRAAGGGMSVRSDSSGPSRMDYQERRANPIEFDAPPTSMEDLDPRREARRLSGESQRDPKRGDREDLLKSMTGNSGTTQKSAAPAQDKSKGNSGDVYGELEKKLGLK